MVRVKWMSEWEIGQSEVQQWTNHHHSHPAPANPNSMLKIDPPDRVSNKKWPLNLTNQRNQKKPTKTITGMHIYVQFPLIRERRDSLEKLRDFKATRSYWQQVWKSTWVVHSLCMIILFGNCKNSFPPDLYESSCDIKLINQEKSFPYNTKYVSWP